MERADAVVVGSGPAGSLTAWSLAREGVHVELIDRAHFPREKVCGGWVNRAVLRDFPDLELEGSAALGTPFFSITFHTPDLHSRVTWSPGEVIGYLTRRCAFDDALLRQRWRRERDCARPRWSDP